MELRDCQACYLSESVEGTFSSYQAHLRNKIDYNQKQT